MNDFEIIQTLATSLHFNVFEAYAKNLHLKVVLKQCFYSKDEEAEFLVRSILMKAKNSIYSHPLVSIFADVDAVTSRTSLVFVWKKGNSLKRIVELNEKSSFPSGKAGLEQVEVISQNPLNATSIKHAHCITLDRKVLLKVTTFMDTLEANSAFKEALTLVQCNHPNICELLDFRLFSTKKGKHRTYIVMESLNDLAKEIEERKSLAQPYRESELLEILRDVSSALVHAKSSNIAHRDIQPSSIMRASQRVKVSNFVSMWPKRQANFNAQDSYMNPAWRTVDSSELQPFECDVYCLGMSMLHLAALELPARTWSGRELHTLLQREVNSLQYSCEFKQLVWAMISVSLHGRPPIETVQEDAIRILHQIAKNENLPAVTITLDRQPLELQEADRFVQQALSNFEAEKYTEAAELHDAAHAIYSRLHDDKATANNLRHWGWALRRMKSYTEAERKHATAGALYSHFPSDKDTALNFCHWGNALNNMENYLEAKRKYAAAEAVFSRFSNDKDTAYCFTSWGLVHFNMKNYVEAEKKYAQADAIYLHFFSDKDTAFNLVAWGDALENMGKSEEAMSKYEEADVTYSRCPENKITFLYLMNWLGALKKKKDNEKAARVLAAAEARYSSHPNKKFAADVLYEWGVVQKEMRNNGSAVKKYEAADAFFSAFFPNDKDTAVNLNMWGHALLELKSFEEASKKFSAAHTILFHLCPDGLDIAVNLSNWALALCRMKNNEECFKKFAAANTVFSRLPGDAAAAENFYLWGWALWETGNHKEAVSRCAAADVLYTHLFTDKIRIAENLYLWANVLYKIGNSEEAVSKYEGARAIYSTIGKTADAGVCDQTITKLV